MPTSNDGTKIVLKANKSEADKLHALYLGKAAKATGRRKALLMQTAKSWKKCSDSAL